MVEGWEGEDQLPGSSSSKDQNTQLYLGEKSRVISLNPPEKDNIYIFTVCQYQI